MRLVKLISPHGFMSRIRIDAGRLATAVALKEVFQTKKNVICADVDKQSFVP